MTEFSSRDQWRSFQTFVAAYLAGMRHPRDVFTISRRESVAPPLVEFRCDSTARLWLSIGAKAWSDEDGASVAVRREDVNKAAEQTLYALRELARVPDPGELHLSGSGPASSVAVLAKGGFMSGGRPEGIDRDRQAALAARMAADIDVEGDVIEAAARVVGDRAYAGTQNGAIAAQAAAVKLARLRNWLDPFSATRKEGFLVGDRLEQPEQRGQA